MRGTSSASQLRHVKNTLRAMGFKSSRQQDAFITLLGKIALRIPEGKPVPSQEKIITALASEHGLDFSNEKEAYLSLRCVTQDQFMRPPGDRANIPADHSFVRADFVDLIKTLGLGDEVPPQKSHYDAVVILGSTEANVSARSAYCAQLKRRGITFGHMALLGATSEFPMMGQAYGNFVPAESAHYIHNVPTPPPATHERANTRDTIHKLLEIFSKEEVNPGTDILFISNQPYVDYQKAVIGNEMTHRGFHVETVGSQLNVDKKDMPVAIDSIARIIYESQGRVRQAYPENHPLN